MRDQLIAQRDAAQKEYDKDRTAYREALAEKQAADEKVREACGKASATANAIAALNAAVEKLPA